MTLMRDLSDFTSTLDDIYSQVEGLLSHAETAQEMVDQIEIADGRREEQQLRASLNSLAKGLADLRNQIA